MKLFLLTLLFALFYFESLAQGENYVVLSGIVIDGKTGDPIPGVHFYIPKAGRGTAASSLGLFSLPTLPNDSVIISAIGYQTHFYLIPKREYGIFSVVIELKEDNILLPVVEVFPYPTEELFKEAFLALQLPNQEQMYALKQSTRSGLLYKGGLTLGMDASANASFYLKQQIQNTSGGGIGLNILNPFAWARFIKSIKKK